MKFFARLLSFGAQLNAILIVISFVGCATQSMAKPRTLTGFSVLVQSGRTLAPVSATEFHETVDNRGSASLSFNNIFGVARTARVFSWIRYSTCSSLIKLLGFAIEPQESIGSSKIRIRPNYTNTTQYCQTNDSELAFIINKESENTTCPERPKPTPIYPASVLVLIISVYCLAVSFFTYLYRVSFIKCVLLSSVIWFINSHSHTLLPNTMFLILHVSILSLDYVCLSLEHFLLICLHCLALLAAVRDIPGILLQRLVHYTSQRVLEVTFGAVVRMLVFVDSLLSAVDITKLRLRTREARRFIERRRKRVALITSTSAGQVPAVVYLTPTKRVEMRERCGAHSRRNSDTSGSGSVVSKDDSDVFRSNGAVLEDDIDVFGSPIFTSPVPRRDSIGHLSSSPSPVSKSGGDVLKSSTPISKMGDGGVLKSNSPSPSSKNASKDLLNCRPSPMGVTKVLRSNDTVLTSSSPSPVFSKSSSLVPGSVGDVLKSSSPARSRDDTDAPSRKRYVLTSRSPSPVFSRSTNPVAGSGGDVLSPASKSSSSTSSWRSDTPGKVRYTATRAIVRRGVNNVFVAQNADTNEQVILRTAVLDSHDRDSLRSEVMVLRKICGSPWFPTLIDRYSERGETKFVTTFYPRGSLGAYVLKMGGCLSHDCARFYLAEIMLALEALHSRGIVHHGINLQNLLLTDEGHIVISNFSQATRNHFILHTNSKRRRTVRFDGDAPGDEITRKAMDRAVENGDYDYYQMALVFHQMITGKKLKFIEPLVHEDIVSLREHMQEMEKVDIAFLEMVLDKFPFECAMLPEMLAHPIFDHLDFTAMRTQAVPVPDMRYQPARSEPSKPREKMPPPVKAERSSVDWIEESPFMRIPPRPSEASPMNTPEWEMADRMEYYGDE